MYALQPVFGVLDPPDPRSPPSPHGCGYAFYTGLFILIIQWWICFRHLFLPLSAFETGADEARSKKKHNLFQSLTAWKCMRQC